MLNLGQGGIRAMIEMSQLLLRYQKYFQNQTKWPKKHVSTKKVPSYGGVNSCYSIQNMSVKAGY